MQPYENKKGLHRITLQIIVNRVKLNVKTSFSVKANQFRSEKVTGHELAEKYNYNIKQQKLDIENKLLEAFKHKSKFTKSELDLIVRGRRMNSLKFTDFADRYKEDMKDKLSEGRLKKYQTMINKIAAYAPETVLTDINGEWLTAFEHHLRKGNIMNSTIAYNIKAVKAIVRAARKRKLIPAEDFTSYTPLRIVYRSPGFLPEKEIAAFWEACDKQTTAPMRVTGYLFLLSCHAGLRISDALKFDKTMVKNGELVYYAQKNKKRCAVPIYPALRQIIDVLLANPYKYHENTVRVNVRKIMQEAGITRSVVYHISRHTFCTNMLQKGFTIPEVADMVGDTIKTISETYAHVDRHSLKMKVAALLG
ncbi:MAG: tyrosine-type recombinase/integrase [Parafilimonas sp.]